MKTLLTVKFTIFINTQKNCSAVSVVARKRQRHDKSIKCQYLINLGLYEATTDRSEIKASSCRTINGHWAGKKIQKGFRSNWPTVRGVGGSDFTECGKINKNFRI